MDIKYKSWECPLKIAMGITEIVKSDAEQLDKNIRLLALLSDSSEDEISELPIDEFNKAVANLKWINTAPIGEFKKDKIVLNNREYEICTDLKHLTISQYIDFQNFQKGDTIKNIKYLLAVFIIPKGKKYGEEYNVDEVANDIWENMPYIYVEGLLAFFLTAFESLITTILTYSERQMKRAMKKEKAMKKKMMIGRQIINLQHLRRSLQKNGGGLL